MPDKLLKAAEKWKRKAREAIEKVPPERWIEEYRKAMLKYSSDDEAED